MKIAFLAPSDAYLMNFRGALAEALQAAGHDVVMVAPPGSFGGQFEARGYCWFPAPMNRAGINPFKELWLIFWLYRLFRREKVDLVHGFVIKGALYGALAGRLAGVPARVSSITGMGYLFLSQELLARALRVVVRVLCRVAFKGTGSRVILQNRDDLELFRAAGLGRPESLVMIPGSGVDCERFAPAPMVDECDPSAQSGAAPSAGFRVLLPARLLWHKGLKEYVEAARLLRDQGRAVQFLLAGEPDLSNPSSIPESTVRAWTRDGLIEWLGYVHDMPALLHTLNVVVLPSYREGLPKVLVEGAGCALPLIATDVPGCREVITDGVEGLLVPVGDPHALAAAIARLQDEPETCTAMGKRARAKALAKFEEGIIISHMFALYAEILPGFDASRYARPGPA